MLSFVSILVGEGWYSDMFTPVCDISTLVRKLINGSMPPDWPSLRSLKCVEVGRGYSYCDKCLQNGLVCLGMQVS